MPSRWPFTHLRRGSRNHPLYLFPRGLTSCLPSSLTATSYLICFLLTFFLYFRKPQSPASGQADFLLSCGHFSHELFQSSRCAMSKITREHCKITQRPSSRIMRKTVHWSIRAPAWHSILTCALINAMKGGVASSYLRIHKATGYIPFLILFI